MPTSTYVALATTTLSGTDSAIVFDSIPAGYRDLVLTGSVKAATVAYCLVRLNDDSGSNYSSVVMSGSSSGATSQAETSVWAQIGYYAQFQSDHYGVLQIQFLDYSATDKHKTFLARESIPDDFVIASANRWASTSAISKIYLNLTNGAVAGSTFSLYGIEA